MGPTTYTELLDKANVFMYRSGIRHFCRTQCGGKCCEMLKEFDSDMRCRERISCERKLPCALFLCGRVEFYLQGVMEIGDRRWAEFPALFQEVTGGIVGRLEALGVSMPDACRSTYSFKDVESLTFDTDYPDFTVDECLRIKETLCGTTNIS